MLTAIALGGRTKIPNDSSRRRLQSFLAADAFVDPAEGFEFFWVEEISAVEEDGAGHDFAGALEVKFLEDGPFGGDDEGVAAFGDEVHVAAIGGVGEDSFGLFHGFGIIDAEPGSFPFKALAEIDGGGHADVVGVLFEGKAKDADGFVFEDPEGIGDFFQESIHLVGIDFLHFLEESKIVAELFGNFDEGAEVFGETTTAEAERGIEEAAADAFIHAHASGDFLDVGAGGFADDGDGVDVGNF